MRSQVFRFASPPMSSRPIESTDHLEHAGLARRSAASPPGPRATSSSVSRPSSTIARANAFSASNAVSPSAALASRSAPSGPSATVSAPAAVFRAIIPSSVARICASVGSGKSTQRDQRFQLRRNPRGRRDQDQGPRHGTVLVEPDGVLDLPDQLGVGRRVRRAQPRVQVQKDHHAGHGQRGGRGQRRVRGAGLRIAGLTEGSEPVGGRPRVHLPGGGDLGRSPTTAAISASTRDSSAVWMDSSGKRARISRRRFVAKSSTTRCSLGRSPS